MPSREMTTDERAHGNCRRLAERMVSASRPERFVVERARELFLSPALRLPRPASMDAVIFAATSSLSAVLLLFVSKIVVVSGLVHPASARDAARRMKKISMTGKVFIGVPFPVLHMNIIKPFDTAMRGDSPKDRGSEETNRIPCTLCSVCSITLFIVYNNCKDFLPV